MEMSVGIKLVKNNRGRLFEWPTQLIITALLKAQPNLALVVYILEVAHNHVVEISQNHMS